VASGLNMELTTDVMAKIAAVALSTEEGAAMVEGLLTKAANAEKAREILSYVAGQAELAEKTAAYNAGAADVDRLLKIAEAQYTAGNGLAQVKQATYAHIMAKRASVKRASAQTGFSATRMLKLYKLGQAIAEAGGDPTPENIEALAASGGTPDVPVDDMGAGAGAEGEEIAPEEVVQALQEMVQSGEIQPEEADAVMQEVEGGEGGEGGAEGGMGAEGEDPDSGITLEDAAATIDEMVSNQEIEPEQGQALLEAIISESGAGGDMGGDMGEAPAPAGEAPAPAGEAPAPAGEAPAPAGEAPADAGAEKVANLLASVRALSASRSK